MAGKPQTAGLVVRALEYNDVLYRIALHYTKNPSDAEELLQEAYTRLLRYSQDPQAQPIDSVQAFARRTLRNVATDWCRRRKIAPIEFVEDLASLERADESPRIEDRVALEQDIQLVREAILQLPQKYREVIDQAKVREKRQSEIARDLRISERSVRARLQAAMKLLTSFFDSRGSLSSTPVRGSDEGASEEASS